jgi:hypothetical protein
VSRDRKETFYENSQNKKLVLKKSVHFDIAKSLLIYINRCGLQVKAMVCHAGGHGFDSIQAHIFCCFFFKFVKIHFFLNLLGSEGS